MGHAPHRPLLRGSLVAALSACIAGCAGFGSAGPDSAAAVLPEGLSVQAASTAVAPGVTRDAVRARLGPAVEIRFGQGYEVWVYRGREAAPDAGGRSEFVVLFAPSGIVKKTRFRRPDGVPGP
jgi:hypothetical protein